MLVWGLDAKAVTFIAAHSLHARPLVVPRGRDVEIENRTVGRPGPGSRRRQPGDAAGSRASESWRGSAPSARFSRTCPRRPSSGATGRPLLRRLRIENLVLIREAELEPGAGLNAITGETGAGKTILAQAIGLLLGAKGDAGFVGPGRRRGVRRGRVRPAAGAARRGRARGAARAAARGRGRARARAAGVRRRAHARVRVGEERCPGRPRGGGRAADRDVRPVRAAQARAARRTSSTSSTRSSARSSCASDRSCGPRGASSGPPAGVTRS